MSSPHAATHASTVAAPGTGPALHVVLLSAWIQAFLPSFRGLATRAAGSGAARASGGSTVRNQRFAT
ncbi:hypothetical protein HMPREF9440_02461 [Sutterella parvirubra YIT 11816]|uniref:Uncharacterized protein n=1 Tax=Sutterella parvirubra YIT 11816 TaxID=762967 RepID=H3KI59_9BURK|nr:hypothetical protein HMPREF9440_02461 [Sutterella parvirubra YIT 11816]